MLQSIPSSTYQHAWSLGYLSLARTLVWATGKWVLHSNPAPYSPAMVCQFSALVSVLYQKMWSNDQITAIYILILLFAFVSFHNYHWTCIVSCIWNCTSFTLLYVLLCLIFCFGGGVLSISTLFFYKLMLNVTSVNYLQLFCLFYYLFQNFALSRAAVLAVPLVTMVVNECKVCYPQNFLITTHWIKPVQFCKSSRAVSTPYHFSTPLWDFLTASTFFHQ